MCSICLCLYILYFVVVFFKTFKEVPQVGSQRNTWAFASFSSKADVILETDVTCHTGFGFRPSFFCLVLVCEVTCNQSSVASLSAAFIPILRRVWKSGITERKPARIRVQKQVALHRKT